MVVGTSSLIFYEFNFCLGIRWLEIIYEKRFMRFERRLYTFTVILLASIIGYGCGPLQPYTADDFRGVTYQRYEQSPSQVLRAVETVVEEQEAIDWEVDSTYTENDNLALLTSFSSSDAEYDESVRLKATIRKDRGTLASFDIQDEDTSNVYSDKIYQELTKPMFEDLAETHLTMTNVSEQLEGTEDEWQNRDTFFDRIGFFTNVDAGASLRHNTYTSTDTLRSESGEDINYQTQNLRFADTHARIGLAGIQLAEYNYETMPNTNFQREAFDFNEDENVGLEKYTYGVDLLPLWMVLLPDDSPGAVNFITRLLSARFRSVKELTQTTAEATASFKTYPALEDVDTGDSYSFRTRYRYQSVSIPLYLFMANQGHVNIGMAHWKFSRTYAMTRLPDAKEQFIFDGAVETVGPVLEIYYEVHKSTLGRALGRSGRTMPEALEGLRVDFFFGAGIMGEYGFNIEGGELAEVANDEEIEPYNFNAELSLSYPIKMLQASNMFDLSLRIGGEANAFTTYFNNYYDYSKTDWIFNPWFRLSLGFN